MLTNEEINKNLNNDLFNDIGDVSNKNMFEKKFLYYSY